MFSKDKAKIAAIRHKKFASYCQSHRLDPLKVKCLCGNGATGIKFNSPTCERCMSVEERLSGHHGNIWASNPARVKTSKYYHNRLKSCEVGPFDPDIYGLRIVI